MTRQSCIDFLEDCADDLCICGVASNQIDLDKLSDLELETLVGIVKKIKLSD